MIHCSAQTSSRHVVQKLSQSCLLLSSNTGRVFRPKDCENMVLYLKDINLPKPDKWGTSNLIAFLQQVMNGKMKGFKKPTGIYSLSFPAHFQLLDYEETAALSMICVPLSCSFLQVVTYNGFYNESLEWVSLENIQVVASMSTGCALGSHSVTSRLSSIVRICTVEYVFKVICKFYYKLGLQIQTASFWCEKRNDFSPFCACGCSSPDREQLQTIYSVYLQPVLQRSLGSQAGWASTGRAHQLAGSLVELYEQVFFHTPLYVY